MIRRFEKFVSSAAFAALLTGILLAVLVLQVTVLLWPPGEGAAAEFAAEIRKWCLNWDAGNEEATRMWIVTMLLQPFALLGILAVVWWSPVKTAWAERRGWLLRWASTGVAVVALSTTGLWVFVDPSESVPLEMDLAAIRTAVPLPQAQLIDQNEDSFAMSDFEGRVVLVTSFYASCPHTCPAIISQLLSVVGDVPAEAELSVVAVSMDPATDTPAVLSTMAHARDMHAPRYRLATGQKDTVNAYLDLLGFQRSRDPETGVINHANLFVLVDRQGKIAWRFALGEEQEPKLREALDLLLAEPSALAAADPSPQ